MPRVKITKQIVDKIKSERPKSGKVFTRDASLLGFGIKSTPSKSVYIVERRVGRTGPVRRVEIGDVYLVPLEQARIQAQALLASLAAGIDLSNEARKKNAVPTLRQVFDEMIATRSYKPTTASQYQRRFDYGFSDWADREITSITEDEIMQRNQDLVWVKRGRHAKNRKTGRAMASLCMTILSAIFSFAKPRLKGADGNRLLKFNPVSILADTRTRYKIPTRKNYISRTQLPFFFDAVISLPRPELRAFFLWLVLSGHRKNEAKLLKWSEIDWRAGAVRLPDERCKTGARVTPITRQLGVILQAMKRHQQGRGSEYVFYSPDYQAVTSDRTLYPTVEKLRRASGIEDLSIHGLRLTYITHSSSLLPVQHLKKLVGHSDDITGLYDCATVDDLRESGQTAVDHLEKLMTNGAAFDAELLLSGRKSTPIIDFAQTAN